LALRDVRFEFVGLGNMTCGVEPCWQEARAISKKYPKFNALLGRLQRECAGISLTESVKVSLSSRVEKTPSCGSYQSAKRLKKHYMKRGDSF
jgi:hypothetical protein